ncbi:MAG: hypothetical protein JKY32_07210 [Rhizobiales bacterium]|nr:hypothetical protein [Hyphomicrobiales bacterium]
MKPKHTIIFLRETITECFIRDASTLLTVLAMIGIGVYVESDAMQWLGAVFAFIAIMSKSKSVALHYNLEEAAQKIKEMMEESK